MVRALVVISLAFTICAVPAFSQSTAPKFEVASVKIAGPLLPGSGPRGGPGTNDPTRFTYPRANLQNLLMRAYGVRTDQISGPDWIKDYSDDRTQYEVTAVVPAGASKEQFNVMLQNLLTERFHLALHHDSKEFPGYELVVAEGGPKIKEYVPAAAPSGPGVDSDGFPRLGPGASVSTMMPRIGGGWAMIRSRYRMPMSQFIVGLGAAINESMGVEMSANMARVIDKTGLSGVYEFTLGFAGMMIMPNVAPPPGSTGEAPAHVASDPGEVGPSLFSALEKQLGLKLVKMKNIPVDILVIDHADKTPTDN